MTQNAEIKQIDISKKTGIDKTSISKYCGGKAEPDAANLFKLANFFGVSPIWLSGDDVPVITPNFDELIDKATKDTNLNITGSYGIGKSSLLKNAITYTLNPKEQELKDLIDEAKLPDEKLDILIDMIKSWK